LHIKLVYTVFTIIGIYVILGKNVYSIRKRIGEYYLGSAEDLAWIIKKTEEEEV